MPKINPETQNLRLEKKKQKNIDNKKIVLSR